MRSDTSVCVCVHFPCKTLNCNETPVIMVEKTQRGGWEDAITTHKRGL